MPRSFVLATVLAALAALATDAWAAESAKEWTLLIFLNGNNNLDRFARDNLADIERVGSSDQVNVVVQWADYEYKDTRRLFITRDDKADPDHLSRPTVEDLGPHVDMGDWRTLAEFIRWGAEHYPAKHYFVDVWDHGTGWHDLTAKDISEDDHSKHWITTTQLGQAFDEAARAIGHPIDLYGNDACEMAMIEVATELAGSVGIYAASEAEIPVDGWPYRDFLPHLEAHPEMSALDVARTLEKDFIAYYVALNDKHKPATFSVVDLAALPTMLGAIKQLGTALGGLAGKDVAAAREALSDTEGFSIDYIDLLELGEALGRRNLGPVVDAALKDVRDATAQFVRANDTTRSFAGHARGLSIWIPPWRKIYDQYVALYGRLKFDAATHWADGIRAISRLKK